MANLAGSTGVRMETVRTCIGCRSRSSRSELFRIVAREGVVLADMGARLGGRGAWLHLKSECFNKAKSRRAFTRALRTEGELDTIQLENRLNG